METQLSNFKYVAFISYQRKDEEWARWFHHQLEHYHLPTDIANGKNDDNGLRPMFLDEAELSGGSLANEISSALDNSRYLIVLCSPNSAKSEWVNLEVQTFINSGRRKSVIPVIVGGVPYSDDSDMECFMPVLKSLRGTDKELLAINAQNGKEIASVKIIAQILGVSFDSLWNRYELEKELERKKLIEEKRRLQRLESRYLSEKGRDAVAAGNNLLAVKLALRALPENIYDAEDRPFVDEASDMLYHAIESNDGIVARDISGSVHYAEFNDNGKQIVTCGDGINIWNTETGARLKHIPFEHFISFIKFSPDYSKMVGVGPNNVYLVNFKNDTLLGIKREESYYDYAEFSPDGTLIAAIVNQTQIAIYDAETLEELHRLVGHTDVVNTLAFFPGTSILFSCGADNTMRVWDAEIGEGLETIDIGSRCYYISFDRNGEKQLYAMSNNTIVVIDYASGNLIAELGVEDGHTDTIRSARFSYDGKLVISVSSDKTVKLWDIESCQCIKTIIHDLSTNAMQCAALSIDGKKIVSSDTVMKITNVELGNFHNIRYREIQNSELGGALIKAFSHDSHHLYFCTRQRGEDGIEYYKLDLENDATERLFINVNKSEADSSNILSQAKFYSIAPPTNDILNKLKNQLLGTVDAMFVTPDNQHLLLNIYGDDLYLVEAANGKLVRKINVGGKKIREIYLGWRPDIILLRVDRELYSFDLGTLESTWILNLDDYYPDTVDIFADYNGNLYIMQSPVTITDDQDKIQVSVYNVFSNQVIKTFQRPTSKEMFIRVLSPNGKCMLLGDQIWDIEKGQYCQKFMTNNRKLDNVIFSPDGKYLVSTNEHYVTLWDVETGQYFYSIERGNNKNCTAIFSPDGTKCAFSSGDGKVMAWDFITPQALIEQVRSSFAGSKLSDYEKQALYIE